MSLDVLSYVQNQDLSITKTVVSTVANPQEELNALQLQLADFQAGQQTPDIVDAIQNYTDQIAILTPAVQTLPPLQKPLT